MRIKALENFILKIRPKYAVIFLHHNADPDALYAANIFFKLARKLKPGIKCAIVPVGGISSLTKTLLKKAYVKTTDSPSLEKANLVVLVDTSTLEQLDEWGVKVKELKKPLLVIDHHSIHPETAKLASLMLIEPKARSACELMFQLSRLARLKLSRNDSLGLLFGMLFETKGFRYGSAETFRAVYEIVKSGVRIEDVFQAFASQLSPSEKIARLKAASRLKSEKVGGCILVWSHVSSYQASAARALLGLGADAAIVGGESKGKIRISLRSTSNFHEATGIHLGEDVAFRLEEKFSGSGGGHAASAGFNGTGNLEEALLEAVSLLKNRIIQVAKH